MEPLIIQALINAGVDIIITYVFMTLLVRVFEIGQKALFARLETRAAAKVMHAYEVLPYFGRIGYIIMNGTLMTKIMIAVMLPGTLYAGLMLGHSLEFAIEVLAIASQR